MSSWIDRCAVETTLKLKEEFKTDIFIETGTFRGVCAEFYSKYFSCVITCENNKEYHALSKKRLDKYDNVCTAFSDSSEFLNNIIKIYQESDDVPNIFFFLDAHNESSDWTVVKELKQLKNLRNCIIVIHDFDCSDLGHLVRDGKHLNWNVVKYYLYDVNPYFKYYCNTKEYCDIIDIDKIKELDITIDDMSIDMIKHANSMGELKNRGILYAVPKSLDLNKYKLKEFSCD